MRCFAVTLLATLSAVAPARAQDGPRAAERETADASASLAVLDAIPVSEIRIAGSSVFTADELDSFTAPYAHRVVTIEELHELRHALSRAYVERGYVSSGVVIPDQRVADGAITLQAIEGALGPIEVDGNRRFSERAIERRIRRHVAAPVNIGDLQSGLRLLEQEPLVERVQAQLLPGAAPGESRLHVAIVERPAFEIEAAAANDRSPSVGEDRGTVALTYRGLAGNGDALTGRFGVTEGVRDNALAYRVPAGPRGTLLELLATDQEADIVEEPFDAIDIESRLRSFGLTASVPIIRTPDRTLLAIAGLEHKRSESTLLGMPFSFSPGDVDGKARGTAVSLGAEWTRRARRSAWAARGVFRIGVDAFDATVHEAGPDSESSAFAGHARYIRALGWRDSRLLVNGAVQLARDPLLAMYKQPIGGRDSVRGYRENQFVRDNGVAASVEWQFPPLLDAAGRARGNLLLALFVDHGVAWDEDDRLPTAAKARITSAGLGVLWDPTPGLHLDVYWGADLDDQQTPTTTLQDDGIHYRFSYRRRF